MTDSAHGLITDHNGDPRCQCGWAPDPAECGPGINGQLHAAAAINRHAKQCKTAPMGDLFPDQQHQMDALNREVKAALAKSWGAELIDPQRLLELQDGAVVFYRVEAGPEKRNVMIRDRGSWWVAGNKTPISDSDLTDEALAALRRINEFWILPRP